MKEKWPNDFPYDFRFPPTVQVGYPSSGEGSWVHKFLEDSDDWHDGDAWTPSLRQRPELWNTRMAYVLTVDERCEVMKSFGAMFLEKAEDWEDAHRGCTKRTPLRPVVDEDGR